MVISRGKSKIAFDFELIFGRCEHSLFAAILVHHACLHFEESTKDFEENLIKGTTPLFHSTRQRTHQN